MWLCQGFSLWFWLITNVLLCLMSELSMFHSLLTYVCFSPLSLVRNWIKDFFLGLSVVIQDPIQ